MQERLQKLIAGRGLASRRQAEQWIASGRVLVNGAPARLGDTADPVRDTITVDGAPLAAAPAPVYVMLHKPRGYVTTLRDERGRKTVQDLLHDCPVRVHPVGRLDQYSEGLLLLTNDGALTQRLTHPSHQVDKTYLVWVTGFSLGALEALARPIVLDGRKIAKPAVRCLWQGRGGAAGDHDPRGPQPADPPDVPGGTAARKPAQAHPRGRADPGGPAGGGVALLNGGGSRKAKKSVKKFCRMRDCILQNFFIFCMIASVFREVLFAPSEGIMVADILTVIQSRMSKFSKGQKLIAKYILSAYDKAAFMTASKLGGVVQVSESTVVRFAVGLGYDGYPEMQKALQEMILNRLTSVQRMEVTNDRIGDRDVLSMVLQADIDKIRQTNELADRQTFAAAVNTILNAAHIYIIGVRSSAPLANFLGFYYGYMFDNVCVVNNAGVGDLFERLIRITPEDVVIGISFPRYSTSTTKAVQFCRDVGARVIALTDYADSPVGRCADHVLVAKSDMVSLVDSLVAPLSLINALIVATAQRREGELSHTFAELERIWDKYEVYERAINEKPVGAV